MSKHNLGITWDSVWSEKDVSVMEGFFGGENLLQICYGSLKE